MKEITCKTFEKQIGAFFDDDLDNAELSAFLAHADSCEDCREELTIRLLMRVGLQYLEDGRTFHLGNEMDRMMRVARQRLVRRQRLKRIAGAGVGVVSAGVVLVAVIAWLILL